MNRKATRRRGLFLKILIPMTLVMLLQAILTTSTIFYGSTFRELNEGVVADFEGQVRQCQSRLENRMIDSWGNIIGDGSILSKKIDLFMRENNVTVTQISESHELSTQVIDLIYQDLYMILRRNGVNSVFFIVNNRQGDNYDGFYIFDRNPNVDSYNDGDILTEVAPLDIKRKCMAQGFDSSVNFETHFHLSPETDAFYYTVMGAAEAYPSADPASLGRWMDSFQVHGNSSITYQLPVIVGGQPLGVLGVGVDKGQFAAYVASDAGSLANVCLVEWNDGQYRPITTALQDRDLWDREVTGSGGTRFQGLRQLKLAGTRQIFDFTTFTLNLYSSSSYFYGSQWQLVGLIDESILFASSQTAVHQVLMVIFLSMLLGLGSVISISYIVARPIYTISNHISRGDLDIPYSNIYEIDVFIDRLKHFIAKTLEVPNRMNRILRMVNLGIAAFEFIPDQAAVSVTDKFFELLGLPQPENGELLTVAQFDSLMESLCKEQVSLEHGDQVFYLRQVNRWIRLRFLGSQSGYTGIVQDITTEIKDRQKVERERDYDVLTGLLNRRGFQREIDHIWHRDPHGLLLMMDLDNLKKINDSYGHDFGDDYIKLVAAVVKQFQSDTFLGCHLSGDEFMVYVHGLPREQIEALMEQFNQALREAHMDVFGDRIYAQMSCGMVFRDESSPNFETLRKKADFTMYEVKSGQKNRCLYFSQERYQANEHHYQMLEAFRKLLQEREVHYAFQAIVDIRTGNILGYEALMRPVNPQLRSPLDVIELAKQTNRVADIEALTFFCTMEYYSKKVTDRRTLLFINSLSSQVISQDQLQKLRTRYGHIFRNVVVEICEEENLNKQAMTEKLEMVRSSGMQLAIDDYGTGYNNLSLILNYQASFLKLDDSLIRDIDSDERKRTLAKSIIDYCKTYEISVVAESVETFEELRTVKDLGVDYVQGYLLQRPSFSMEPLSERALEALKKLNEA